MFRGLLDRGFRPALAFAAGIFARLHRDQAIVHQTSGFGSHEIQISRIGRGDDGLAEIHRLRQAESESLGSVERHVGIARHQQTFHFFRIQRAVDQHGVGRQRIHFLAQAGQGPGIAIPAADLQEQLDVRPGTNLAQPPEGREDGPRIFPLGIGRAIERKKEDLRRPRNAPFRAGTVAADLRRDRKRGQEHVAADRRPQRRNHEFRKAPDLVEPLQLPRPMRRIRRQFPGGKDDVERAGRRRAELGQDGLHFIAVDVEEIDPGPRSPD